MKENIKYAHADGDLFEFPEVSSELVITNKKKLCNSICNIEGVTGFICSLLERRCVENFVFVVFDNRKKPICYSIIGRGTETRAHFSIGEILRVAILSNAACAVIYHNHTRSGVHENIEPSDADDKAVQYIYDRLADIGVLMFDSIIIGYGRKTYSYRKEKRGPYKQNEENEGNQNE